MMSQELDSALAKFFRELAELLKTANELAKEELGAKGGKGNGKPPRVGNLGQPPDQP